MQTTHKWETPLNVNVASTLAYVSPRSKRIARENSFSSQTILPRNMAAHDWSTGHCIHHARKWRVNHIKQGIGTSITIKYENSEMIVDKSWFMFDISMSSLVLQRFGFFSNIALKRTTNSIEIWRNILNPDKMMDGKTLTVLLEWTIHGN